MAKQEIPLQDPSVVIEDVDFVIPAVKQDGTIVEITPKAMVYSEKDENGEVVIKKVIV